MFGFNTQLAFLYAVFLFSLLSIFLTLWVVWHVEKKLDVSYKFFALAIVVFTIGLVFEIFQFYGVIAAWQWEKIFKGLLICCNMRPRRTNIASIWPRLLILIFFLLIFSQKLLKTIFLFSNLWRKTIKYICLADSAV